MSRGKKTNVWRIWEAVPFRRGFLALGLALLAAAQVYLETRDPPGQSNVNAAIWNAVHNLELLNYDNVWRALPLLFGGALTWLLFGGFSWNLLPIAPGEEKREAFFYRARAAQILAAAALYALLLFRLARLSKTAFEPLLWIIALAWMTFLFWRWEKGKANLAPDMDAGDFAPILILLIVGIGAGSFALTDIPKQIVRDELPFWEASRVIALGGYNASIFEVGVFTFPLSTSIYQNWVMRIFGVNFWGWKFSSVLAGVAAVVPLYLLARSWFDRRVAFAAGLLMALNPYFLSFSRFGYNNIHSLFPMTLAVYLWESGIRKDNLFYLWLGGLAAGLGYYSYFSAWLAALVAGLGVFCLLGLKRISWKRAGLYLAILAAAFFLAAAPRMVFLFASGRSEAFALKVFQASFVNAFYGRYFYSDADLTRFYPFMDVAGLKEPVFFNPQIYWELFVRGVIRTFLALWNPHVATEHFLSSGFAGAAPVFFTIGLILVLKRWRDVRAVLLLLWFFGGMLFLGVLNSFPPRQTHLVALIPALALFSALGLISAADSFASAGFSRRILSSLTLIILAVFNLHSFFIALPQMHPADFETQAAWVARRNDVRVPVLYAGLPGTDFLVGELIELKILDAPYLALPAEGALDAARQYADLPVLIFLEGGDESLAEEIRRAGYRSAAYDGGYAFTNAAIDLFPRADFRSEWDLFLKSPAPLVMGILFLALCLQPARAALHSKIKT